MITDRQRVTTDDVDVPRLASTGTADLHAFREGFTANLAYIHEEPSISGTSLKPPQAGFAVTISAGHTRGVHSVAFSPDGGLLASGGADCKIRLWDVSTGRDIGKHMKQVPIVHSVAFSSDGATVASGGRDSVVRLFDVGTGQRTRTLAIRPGIGRLGYTWAVAFSPDGTMLASAGGGGIRLWDVKVGRGDRRLLRARGGLRWVQFRRNPVGLAAAGIKPFSYGMCKLAITLLLSSVTRQQSNRSHSARMEPSWPAAVTAQSGYGR